MTAAMKQGKPRYMLPGSLTCFFKYNKRRSPISDCMHRIMTHPIPMIQYDEIMCIWNYILDETAHDNEITPLCQSVVYYSLLLTGTSVISPS